jgi:hypothetical protein
MINRDLKESMPKDNLLILPICILSESCPWPNIFVEKADTLISACGEHKDEDTSNTVVHTPSSQDEAGSVTEPQVFPEVISV